jgi:hypothetical protein
MQTACAAHAARLVAARPAPAHGARVAGARPAVARAACCTPRRATTAATAAVPRARQGGNVLDRPTTKPPPGRESEFDLTCVCCARAGSTGCLAKT